MVSCREGTFDRVVGYHAERGSYTSRAEDHEERDQASRKVDQVSREGDNDYIRERESCRSRRMNYRYNSAGKGSYGG
jgi:hypothetical protein